MRWLLQVFTTELRKILAYRVDFWMQFVMSIFAHVGVAYYLWRAVFDARGIESLRGYSFSGLMLYYLMVPLLQRMIFGPGLGNIAHEIYDGSLSRYLIYPISFFAYKYAQYLANAVMFWVQLFVAVGLFVLFFGVPQDIVFSPVHVLMGGVMVLLGGYLSFVISACMEMAAFWAENVWSVLVMFRFAVSLLGGAMIPLVFFPESMRQLLGLLPFSALAGMPIEALLGKLSFEQWLWGMVSIVVWSVVCSALAGLLWNRGRYRYTGVGI
jgi:ABC-2 type transport system permease protein